MKKILSSVASLSLACLALTVSTSGASTPTTLTGLSAGQILATSFAAANARGSFTTVGATTVLGVKLREVTSSGQRDGYGSENVNGHKGAVVFLRGVVYAKLDPYLVKLDFGVKNSQVANRWISVTRASRFYNSLAVGIAFPSVLQEMHPTGTLSTTPLTTINGVSVVGVSGRINPAINTSVGSETLYVATRAPFLPVQVVIEESQSGVNATITLTPRKWGIRVPVVAPRSFIPISTTALG